MMIDNPIQKTLAFHKKTQVNSFSRYKDEIIPQEFSEKYFKNYSRFDQYPLKKTKLNNNLNLQKTFINRHSERLFSQKPVTYEELSSVLYFSAGINKKYGNRFYPSAGARYPLEIYPLIFNVAGLKKGCYHFSPQHNCLEFLWELKNQKEKILSCFNQEWIKDAAFLLTITAVFKRTQVKYKLRGYRYILLDAGHLCQNIYLVAANLGLRCCSVGGFLDLPLNQLLDLDETKEAVMITVALGK